MTTEIGSDGRLGDFLFAYGPEMDPQVLRARGGGSPEAIAVARLANHRLAFFGRSATWDGGWETLVPEPGSETWGVVYALDASAWDRLDAWMDARLDGGGAYFHFPAEVVDPSGRTYSVRFFKKDVLGDPRLPSLEYLDLIVGGAGLQGLPSAYVDRLRRIVARKASYPVPRPGNPGRGDFAKSDCGTCEAAEADFAPVEDEAC